MEGELLNRLQRSRFDVYILTIGLLFLVVSGYVYLNYYLNQDTKDKITGILIFISIAFGYFFAVIGWLESYENYRKDKELEELKYEIEKIKKTQELNELKKKYKIVEESLFKKIYIRVKNIWCSKK